MWWGFCFLRNKCQRTFLLTVFYNNFDNISKGIEVRGDKIRIAVVLGDPEMLRVVTDFNTTPSKSGQLDTMGLLFEKDVISVISKQSTKLIS